MNYRYVGKAGIQMSELSFGSWITFHTQADQRLALDMMAAAYDAGVNFFDNAEIYAGGRSEEIMGQALKSLAWDRSSYLVSTKLFWGIKDFPNQKNTLNRKYLMEGVNGSLKRLQLEYVDLLYCHRSDPNTPIEETVWAMHNIVESGKAFYWGTSEWSAADIIAAIEIAERHHLHKPIIEQPVYNLFERHRFSEDYARVYNEYGYGSTIWSPLASGLLTGKYKEGIPEGSRGALSSLSWLQGQLTDANRIAMVEALRPIAADLGATLSQFAIAWCLQNPSVTTVITGASRVEQVVENMQATRFVDAFTDEVMDRVETLFSTPPAGS